MRLRSLFLAERIDRYWQRLLEQNPKQMVFWIETIKKIFIIVLLISFVILVIAIGGYLFLTFATATHPATTNATHPATTNATHPATTNATHPATTNATHPATTNATHPATDVFFGVIFIITIISVLVVETLFFIVYFPIRVGTQILFCEGLFYERTKSRRRRL